MVLLLLTLFIATPIVGVCNCSMFCCTCYDGEERAGCFAWFVFLVSRDGCVALPRSAMGLSAVCSIS